MDPFSIAPVISTWVQTVWGAIFDQGKRNGKGEGNTKNLKKYKLISQL